MRDNFSPNVKRVVAQRVAYHCSNPKCNRSTTGPQIEETKSVILGVCAHITAASPGGPRYDPNLTSKERKSPKNAIWLCQFCAKLIDADELKYPKEKLFEWKVSAERAAQKELEKFINELANSEKGIEWVWEEEKRSYRNLQTGIIVLRNRSFLNFTSLENL
ncbi:MAG: hypothetical protein KJ069_30740 [Anaerolineae bacterium]|nr:hypothetical protein [Anaerolineae bacterium]